MDGNNRLFLLVHQACTITACLCNSNAILVTQLVGLLHELLHLLHDHLVLLLILLLVGHLLLWLLVSGREIRHLLLLWLLRGLIPGVGYLITTSGRGTASLLGLASGLFQLFLKFIK